jgi:hypothetical protein
MRILLRRVLPVLPVIVAAACVGCADGRSPAATALSGNQPPFGVIDEPHEGGTVLASVKVAGWAGDDRGIRAIRVLVDGEFAAIAGFVTLRPDVTAVYPHFRHGTDRHGWETTVEILGPGLHIVQVDAVDTDNAMFTLGVRRVTVTAPQSRQERPRP